MRFRQRNARQEDLAAPRLPFVLPPDNLVPVEQLDGGLIVEIDAWGRVTAGDTLTVKWDAEDAYSYVIADPASETFPLVVTVSTAFLQVDGLHEVSYTVQSASGSTSSSEVTAVIIDRQPPNHNNIPEALVFPPEVVQGGLTSEYLASNGDQVVCTIPAFAAMEAGQSVTVEWNAEVPLAPVVLTQEDVDAQSVSVSITGDIIRSTGEGTKRTDYFLTSRAGFDGQRSLPASVDVLLTPAPANLLAPMVPLAADGLVDLVDTDLGVTLEIDAYDHARTGDLILAMWGDVSLPTAIVVQGLFPMEIPVPRGTIMQTGSGDIALSYQVLRYGHGFPSPGASVTVDVTAVGPVDPDPGTPENEALVPPEVRGASDLANELTPEDWNTPATVTVPYYQEAAVGQIVSAYWGPAPDAVEIGSHVVEQLDLDNQSFPGFTVDVPTLQATPNDQAFPVYYTLSRPDTEAPANPVRSPAQAVNVHMAQPGGPDGLDPAVFPDLNEFGWLLLEHVEKGCKVQVNVYENMYEGDVVTLTWQAYGTTNAAEGSEIADTGYTSPPVTVTTVELANGVGFVVPYAQYIEPIASADPSAMGAGKVTYQVRQAGADYSSAEAVVPIDLGHP